MMRRVVSKAALIAVVAALPVVVVVVGHPVLSVMLVEDRTPRQTFGGLTAGVYGHRGDVNGLSVTQMHYPIEGVWGAWVTMTDRTGPSALARIYINTSGLPFEEDSLAPWTPRFPLLDPNGQRDRVMTIAYGWPWVSGVVDYDASRLLSFFSGSPTSGSPFAYPAVNGVAMPVSPLMVQHATAYERRVPTRIVWGGALKNLAVFGGVCWGGPLVGVAAVRVRRSLRRRRGLCVACGYEVAGLDVCPECGAGLVDGQGTSTR